jgi:hypothetical protein
MESLKESGRAWDSVPSLEYLVAAREKVAYQAADEDCGAKEPAPFRNADEAHDQHPYDDYQADGVTGPDARAELAVRNDGHGVEIIIDGSDYLVKRVTTKGNVGFHDVLSFHEKGPQQRE